MCKKWKKYLGKLFLIILFAVSVELFLMFILDRIRYCLLAYFPHHFDGNTWFSVIAAIVASVPGLVCGFLALFQTARIQAMEDRYHRPVFWMKRAVLNFEGCCFDGYDQFDTNENPARFSRYIREVMENLKFENKMAGLLSIELDLELKTELPAMDIKISDIQFRFEEVKKQFKYIEGRNKINTDLLNIIPERHLTQCIFDDGKLMYKVFCDINVELEREDKGNDFWEAINCFLDFKRCNRAEYRNLITIVGMEISYGIEEEQKNAAKLLIRWKADEGNTQDNYSIHQESKQAFFSYKK